MQTDIDLCWTLGYPGFRIQLDWCYTSSQTLQIRTDHTKAHASFTAKCSTTHSPEAVNRDYGLFRGRRDSPLAAVTGSSLDVVAAAEAAVGQKSRRPAVGWMGGSCRTWSADPGGASRRRLRSPGRCPNLLQLRDTERMLTYCALWEWGYFHTSNQVITLLFKVK